jgi:hypothetical protein
MSNIYVFTEKNLQTAIDNMIEHYSNENPKPVITPGMVEYIKKNFRPDEVFDQMWLLAERYVELEAAKVVVEVTGGIAQVTRCPEGIEVLIIDHDNDRR